MACIPAPACTAALNEATRRWPGRKRASDGICPSPEHIAASPNSDHNRGEAFDLTHDPERGVDCNKLATIVIGDARTKYAIWARRIWTPEKGWRAYTGDNPHDKHLHVSIRADCRNDTRDWFRPLPEPVPQEEEDMPPRTVRKGSSGPEYAPMGGGVVVRLGSQEQKKRLVAAKLIADEAPVDLPENEFSVAFPTIRG